MDKFETKESRELFEEDIAPCIADNYPMIGRDVAEIIYNYALFDPNVHTPVYAAETGRLELLEFVVQSKADVSDGHALVAACRNGHAHIVEYLLVEWSVTPWILNDKPIVVAARARHIDIMDLLIDRGADPFCRDYTLLHTAAKKGDLEMMVFLIGDDDIVFMDLVRVLKTAIKYQQMDIIRYLHEHGVSEESDSAGLIYAAECGYLNIVEYFVESGENIHALSEQALIEACIGQHLDIIRYLLDHGADPTAGDHRVISAVCSYDYIAVFKYFIEIGVDIDRNNALDQAVSDGSIKISKYLVEDLDVYVDGDKLFVYACRCGKKDMVQYFAPYINNPDALNNGLCSAIRWKDMEVIQYLIDLGADIRYDDDLALRDASRYGHLSVLDFLIERGADIRANYNQALRHAAIYGPLRTIKHLIKRGADASCALEMAAARGRIEVIRYLAEIGAMKNIRNAIILADINGQHEVIKFLEVYMSRA
jgi:ankyrin repeat protein